MKKYIINGSECFLDRSARFFTGLKCQEGNEIYEGDLLVGDKQIPYRVFYSDFQAGWMLRRDDLLDSDDVLKLNFGSVVSNNFKKSQ